MVDCLQPGKSRAHLSSCSQFHIRSLGLIYCPWTLTNIFRMVLMRLECFRGLNIRVLVTKDVVWRKKPEYLFTFARPTCALLFQHVDLSFFSILYDKLYSSRFYMTNYSSSQFYYDKLYSYTVSRLFNPRLPLILS